jgi:hypothetical protein
MDMPAARDFGQEYPNRDDEYQERLNLDDDSSTINDAHENVNPLDPSSSDYNNITRTDTRCTEGGYGEREGNAVDISVAMERYHSVRKELTTQSRKSRPSITGAVDVEKEGEQDFDLTEYLSDQHSQIISAGLKPKNMGVIWKDLVVQGLGADAQVISTNWTWITSFLQFWKWGKHKGTDFTILKGNNGFCKSGEMLLVVSSNVFSCLTYIY